MTTATPILPTRNPGWGFFGTMERAGESAETAWQIASEEIADALDAHDGFGPEGIRDFLDSRDGRHFADMVAGDIASAGAEGTTLRRAIKAAIANYQRWTISRDIERRDGIPAGLPYLTGWVIHYAILAEADA